MPRLVKKPIAGMLSFFCRTECHHALESVLLQSKSLGRSPGCFSYFLPVMFYIPIAARGEQEQNKTC